MEFDPELLKLLLRLLSHSPWFLLAVMAVWPDKGIVPLWIKGNRDIKLAEIKRDKLIAKVQERASKRLQQEPPLRLTARKGDANDDGH